MSATWEVGDAVPLLFTVAVNGTPTAATVTLTVTLPDASVITPTITNPAVGTYAASFVATLNGTHVYRWAAAGVVVDVNSDSFMVGGIVSLTDAKRQLNKTTTTDDLELQSYCDAIIAPIEDFCGAILPRTVTEWHDSPGGTIVLRSERIVSVASISGYLGTTTYAYTGVATPDLATIYSYIVDPSLNGVIRSLGSGGSMQPFLGRVLVTYTAGFAAVPSAINLAGRMILQSMWDTQRGAKALPTQGAGELVQVDGFSEPIPARAFTLLQRYRRTPSIA